MRTTTIDEIAAGIRAAAQEAATGGRGSALSETERLILAIESTWWLYRGAKEQVVREVLGMGATGYYQALLTLIDKPEALAYDPLTVKRLQRQRAARAAARRGRRDATEGL